MIIYFSKTSTSENIAKVLCKINGEKLFKVSETFPNKGFIGFLKDGFAAVKKREVQINELPSIEMEEDIFIVAPVWAGTTPPAINTVLTIKELANKKVTYIGTCASIKDSENYKRNIVSALQKRGITPAKVLIFTKPKKEPQDLEIVEEHLNKML